MQSLRALSDDEAARTRAIATVAQGEKSEAILDLGADDAPAATATHAAAQSLGSLGDLLGDDAFSTPAMTSSAQSAPSGGNAMDDLLGIFDAPSATPAAPSAAPQGDLLGL